MKVRKLKGALDKYSEADLFKLPPGMHNDQPGSGLKLDVQASGSRSMVFMFKFGGNPKPNYMSFGPLLREGEVGRGSTLQSARQQHKAALDRINAGFNPKEERDGARVEQAKTAKTGITFQGAAQRWLDTMRDVWRSTSRHAGNVESSLTNHVYPKIGTRAMITLNRTDISDVLEPIWHTSPTLGPAIRQIIYNIFDHAFGKDEMLEKAVGRNPADLALMKAALRPKKKRKVKHHASMHYSDVPAFMERLREREAVGGRALEMTILTTLRTGTVIGGKWGEIDLDANVWTIPGERMKNGEDYTLSLTPRMIEILEDMEARREEGNDYIFPGYVIGEGISDTTMLSFLKDQMGETGSTVHGFRSSFRNWAFEKARDSEGMRFLQEVPEICLTHKIGDDTELSYLTAEGRDMTSELLAAWGAYCAAPAPKAGAKVPTNVVRLKARRRAA